MIFRITYKGKSRDISSGFTCKILDWDDKTESLKIKDEETELFQQRLGSNWLRHQEKLLEFEKKSLIQYQNRSCHPAESEFAQITGRAGMYRHLSESEIKAVPELLLGDQQMSTVVGGYYHDENFARLHGEDLSLCQFYNLLKGANKSSYIDSFLQRGINAHDFAQGVLRYKLGEEMCW